MSFSSDFLRNLFFEEGHKLGPDYVAIRAVIVFVVAILYVRGAQRRFIAQTSAMDMVMMVVFGSTLSRGINGGGTLISTLTAGLALVILQRMFARFSYSSRRFSSIAKGEPDIVVRNGKVDLEALRRHGLTEEDLLSDMRTNGCTDNLDQVKVATLERSGQISIVLQSR